MRVHHFSFKSSLINYSVYGNGDKALFCLHGYGESGSSFSFLEKHLGNIYTLYAIDFPFHGKTKWNEKDALFAKDLMMIFDAINNNEHDIFSLLAYSMGGRIALHLLQQNPEKFERIILIAPDGLRANFWYKLSTQTAIGNKMFEQTMKNPKLFFAFLNMGDKIKLLNKSVVKFIHNYLDDKNDRMLLYKRWTIMRFFKPDLSAVKKVCDQKNVQLRLLFGCFDKIILSAHGNIFKNSKNIQLRIIEAGHQLLKEKYAPDIVALLNN